jgi:epoxyqueuosine reductase QueG
MTGERWARSRIFGENNVNSGLRRHLAARLLDQGILAVAPQLLPQWHIMRTPQGYEYSSPWSERHAAHAAGLGTFGLCDGLITAAGKAHRAGSIVINRPLPLTSRPYQSYHEYCPFLSAGRCGACIKRCPAGALSEKGHDKARCAAFLWGKTQPYVEQTWHFEGYGCGLCQVGVPCESGIPRSGKQ